MNKIGALRIIFIFITLIIVFSSISFFKDRENELTQPDFNLLDKPDTNFLQAVDQRDFIFPKDFGKHEEFQTEWWYYTGNLFTETGRHFGYQLTFFRRGISSNDLSGRDSNWASNQIYLAHFIVTDSENIRSFQKEIMTRGALGLADAQSDKYFSVWLYDWKVSQISDNEFELSASTDQYAINLLLKEQKKPILHGIKGLSIKGDELGNASYYFSQTKLSTIGEIEIEGDVQKVSGYSWMDHEFGSNTLGANQIGWDWFSLQFDNNQELMLFQIRGDDGTISKNSSGTLVTSDSETINLTNSDFFITVLDEWKTDDGFRYPSKWLIRIPDKQMEFVVEPIINQQENVFFFRYWEGAVKITGFIGETKILGYGYVELTGYAQILKGVF